MRDDVVDDVAQNLLGVGCLVQFLLRFLGLRRHLMLTVFNVVSLYRICRALPHVPDQRHPLELQFVVQAPPLPGLQQPGQPCLAGYYLLAAQGLVSSSLQLVIR